jgi:murein tripeptide amidase MpaA
MANRFAWRTGIALALTLGLLTGCGFSTPSTGGMRTGTEAQLKAKLADGQQQATVIVSTSGPAQIGKLADAGMDIWGVDGKRVIGSINQRQFQLIKQLKLDVTYLPEKAGLDNTFDPGYHSNVEMLAELKALAGRYPQLARLEDFGDSWEKKQGGQGHDLWVLKIGKGDTTQKPGVIYLGLHHARELVTPEMVLNIAKLLLEGYGKDAELTHYVENREIWLVPMVNPDGHALAEQGADWRKNTNTTYTNQKPGHGPSGPGVDLNRNYGYKWGSPGADTNARGATFRGPEGFSEPETQAIRDLVRQRKWSFLMSYHSFSNLVLWPWGHTNVAPPDNRLPAIGKKLGEFSGYDPKQSVNLYPTSGDTTDWAFGELGILAYTTEIGTWGDGFDPPYSKVSKFWDENRAGALYMLKLADDPSAVFGPELKTVAVRNGQLNASAEASLSEVEVFVGKPGQNGTGMRLSASGMNAAGMLPPSAQSGKQLLLVHARGANGQWGPFEALWSN